MIDAFFDSKNFIFHFIFLLSLMVPLRFALRTFGLKPNDDAVCLQDLMLQRGVAPLTLGPKPSDDAVCLPELTPTTRFARAPHQP